MEPSLFCKACRVESRSLGAHGWDLGDELVGGTVATIRTVCSASVEFTNNHILDLRGWCVDADRSVGAPPNHRDFRGDLWGTTDTAYFDQWIRDCSDDPVANSRVIDYLSIAEQPISVESTSVGEFEARFEP